MSNELKPCPFCGGEAELKCLPVIKGATWFAACSGCSASSSSSNTEEEATEKWNRRTVDVDMLQLVAFELDGNYRAKDYPNIETFCNLINVTDSVQAERIRKAVGL